MSRNDSDRTLLQFEGDSTSVGALASPGALRLQAETGPAAGQSFDVSPTGAVIGRNPDNLIPIPDTSVSRRHAQVSFDGARWIISDLGSGNGTRINSTRLQPNAPSPLQAGDTIHVGETTLRVVPGASGGTMSLQDSGGNTVVSSVAAVLSSARSAPAPAPAPRSGSVRSSANSSKPKPTGGGKPRSGLLVALLVVTVAVVGGVLYQQQQQAASVDDSGAGDEPVAEGEAAADDGSTDWFEKGRQLSREKKWAAAADAYKRAASDKSLDAGRRADASKRADLARTEAEALDAVATANKAFEQGDFAQARRIWTSVAVGTDAHADAQSRLHDLPERLAQTIRDARSALEEGDRTRAQELLDKVLAADPDRNDAQSLRSQLGRGSSARGTTGTSRTDAPSRSGRAGAESKKDSARSSTESTGQAGNSASTAIVDAYIEGELPQAIRLAQESGDPLLATLRQFETNYRQGMQQAESRRPAEALPALRAALAADRAITHGKPSKPGREVGRQVANMEYIKGIELRADDQLPKAAQCYRAALDADPDHALARKMLDTTYARAREIYQEAYTGRQFNPDVARRQFKLVMETLPANDEKRDRAQRFYDSLAAP